MKQLVVREIEDDLAVALEQRAVRNGRSTEDETRAILRLVLRPEVRHSDASHEAIDGLYEELATLVARRRPGREDTELERQVSEVLDQLRARQEAEAREMRSRFERRLSMPIDAGKQALDRVEAFLTGARDEDPTS